MADQSNVLAILVADIDKKIQELTGRDRNGRMDIYQRKIPFEKLPKDLQKLVRQRDKAIKAAEKAARTVTAANDAIVEAVKGRPYQYWRYDKQIRESEAVAKARELGKVEERRKKTERLKAIRAEALLLAASNNDFTHLVAEVQQVAGRKFTDEEQE